MNLRIKLVLILIFGIMQFQDVYGGDMKKLEQKILNRINQIEGDFGIAFQMLGSDSVKLFINEDMNFHAASTMKTPVMIEVFKQASEGKFKLDDSILIKNEFRSIVDGSKYSMEIDRDEGGGFYKFIGKKVPISEAVENMITVSGNLATNNLIEFVGAENVTRTMRSIGANKIRVLRGVEDMKAYEKGLSNTTTPYDLFVIFKALAEGKAVSPAASKQMVKILKRQKFNDLIPKYLPEEVEVAHKTGSITGVRHDSGIVFLPNGKEYILIILSKNLKNTVKGEEVISRISKDIYDFVKGLP